jgi:hypothetical protein
MYIKSRIALGMAANTKRSTSCVMISPNHVVRDKTGTGVPADYTKAYGAAAKMMREENLALTN